MKNLIFAHIHSCWFSQKEIETISKIENDIEDFFVNLNRDKVGKYIKNTQRIEKILTLRSKLDVQKNQKALEKLWVKLITINDRKYPENLKHAPHAPFLLYVRGEIPQQDMFAVVWARNITSYGEKLISQFIPDISRVLPIVSGGAAGCDTHAHKRALEAGEKTVVVMGTWIDMCYPVMNQNLFDQVSSWNGAVISSFPLWEPGNPYNFPARNEIVVGLSRWVLVVEAREKSWSLITANLALDLWKDLFACPWNIFSPLCQWTNKLIASGSAKMTTKTDDILEEYTSILKKKEHSWQLPNMSKKEEIVFGILSEKDVFVDDLSVELQMDLSELAMILSMLELKWIVKKNMLWKFSLK